MLINLGWFAQACLRFSSIRCFIRHFIRVFCVAGDNVKPAVFEAGEVATNTPHRVKVYLCFRAANPFAKFAQDSAPWVNNHAVSEAVALASPAVALIGGGDKNGVLNCATAY